MRVRGHESLRDLRLRPQTPGWGLVSEDAVTLSPAPEPVRAPEDEPARDPV